MACTSSKENIKYKKLGLLNSNQLSRIQYLDSSSINSTAIPTGNTPTNLHVHSCYMAQYSDTTSESTSRKRHRILDPQCDPISSKRGRHGVYDTPSNENLTPVTIMVVDTIGTVKSRRLLKVLLDSGSTTTLINKRCLPRKCQSCKIAQNRVVNILAGFYQSSAMVVMRNLRLPELDKNRNIDQQKALVFQAETCKYDVILGADFLTKSGIDVNYSTGIIEWFEKELPLRDPHTLKDKDYVAIAEVIELQQEVDFFVWIGMIQPDMLLKYLMQSMTRFKLMML